MDLLLAIDQGTTGTTALLMDTDLRVVASADQDFEQHFPEPGWVEHDPEVIWKSVIETIGRVTAKVDVNKIVALGITNQRETLCFWDRETNESLGRAIVWQDRRTAAACEQLRARGMEPFFQESTGLLLDPYFSGTKAGWALHNRDEVKAAHKAGRLALGTIDSFLLMKLTGGSLHATEPSNASRTLAYHLEKHRWDADLCHALGVAVDVWPEVRPSMELFSHTRGVPGLPDGIPITGVLGDQQAALLGQACINEGMAKCTYGTGAFLLMNTGKRIVRSRHRLLTTIAWQTKDMQVTYALEGSAFIAGAAVQWVRDGLGLIGSAHEIEPLVREVDDSGGVAFVPALTGNPPTGVKASGLAEAFTTFARAVETGAPHAPAQPVPPLAPESGPIEYSSNESAEMIAAEHRVSQPAASASNRVTRWER